MEKLNYKRTFTLGFGFLGVMLYTSLYDAFVPVFLREFVDKAWILGFLITVDHYLSIFIQPLIGRLSDRTHTRLGKRIPYILVGLPIVAVLVCLIPNHWSLTSLLIFVISGNLILSCFRSPMIALMPDITPRQHHSKANGIINFMGGIGAAIALSVGAMLYKVDKGYPFYMAAIIMVASAVVLFFKIKEKRDVLEYSKPVSHGVDPALKARIKSPRELMAFIKSSKNALMLLLSIFFLFVAFYCVSSFFTLFAKELLHVEAHVSTMKFAYLVGTLLVFALPAGILSDKIGKKKTMLIGIVIMILDFSCIVFTRDINVIGYLFIPAGIGWALIIVNAYPAVVSMADATNIGSYTGLYYLFSSLSSLASPPLIGMLIDRFGYGILFKYSVGSFVLALVFLLLVKQPKNQELASDT